jgi:ribulose kinase
VGSGNGVRKNPALVSALEKTFGTKMLIPNHTEEAATGAALYGLVSCKAFKTAKEAQNLIKYT